MTVAFGRPEGRGSAGKQAASAPEANVRRGPPEPGAGAACPSPRMLALLTEAFGRTGGIARFNRDFVGALAASGLLSQIEILPRLGDAETAADRSPIRQRPPHLGRTRYGLAAVSAAARLRPGIVLSAHLYHGPLALGLARLGGARLISVLHGTEVWGRISRHHLSPLRASDLVICVSEDTRRRYLEQAGGRGAERVEVLHNTVDERFRPGDRAAARARFGLDDLPVVLTVARLDPRGGYKGHDRVIPVIARLKAGGRRVRYLIAGEGGDRPRLERLVREAGTEDLVRFLGHVPDAALPDLYRAADVFALPSSGEGFGIVFLEAMACGTPAIGLDVGGAGEALSEHGTAVRPEDFPDRLVALLDADRPNPERLSASVRRKYGRARFDRQAVELIDRAGR